MLVLLQVEIRARGEGSLQGAPERTWEVPVSLPFLPVQGQRIRIGPPDLPIDFLGRLSDAEKRALKRVPSYLVTIGEGHYDVPTGTYVVSAVWILHGNASRDDAVAALDLICKCDPWRGPAHLGVNVCLEIMIYARDEDGREVDAGSGIWRVDLTLPFLPLRDGQIELGAPKLSAHDFDQLTDEMRVALSKIGSVLVTVYDGVYDLPRGTYIVDATWTLNHKDDLPAAISTLMSASGDSPSALSQFQNMLGYAE